MPPKRGKNERNGSAPPPAPPPPPPAPPPVNKQWDAALSSAVLQEERWSVYVSLVVCDSVYDEVCMRALCCAVQQPLRRLFGLLSRENLLQKVHELGNPKTRKIKEPPAFYEVTEVAKSVLDSGDELPVNLLAKLIKFQLLDIKNAEIQGRAAAQRATGAVSPVREKSVKSSAKGDKGKKVAAEAPPLQKETKLRRRGEEIPTSYIDDEPDDGPQHYVLLTGFHQPSVISALDSVGVPVSNVIRLKSDRRPAPDEVPEQPTPEESEEERELLSEAAALRQELDVFWKQLDGVLDTAGYQSGLADITVLDYSVDQNLLNRDLTKDEEMQEVGVAVFEGVACLLYDSLDWRRQHEYYLSRTRLIHVPELYRPKKAAEAVTVMKSKPDPRCAEVDLRLYSDLLDRFPLQCVSVALLLHCLIEQVVSSEQEVCDKPAKSGPRSEPERDLIYYMLRSVSGLPAAQQETSKLMDYLGLKEGDQSASLERSPALLHHHDEISKRLHHVPVSDSFDAVSVEVCMMKKSSGLNTLMFEHFDTDGLKTARRHELLHYCSSDSLSSADVQRLLQLCVFESMPLTAVDESGAHTLAASHTALPWDDPRTFARTVYRELNTTRESGAVCDEQQEIKLSVKDLQKTLIRNFRHWNFTEHHSAEVFPQVLQTASEAFRRVDWFHSTQSNVVFIICHNPMSDERSSRGSWEISLHTDVRFRSYLKNVAESIRDWSRAEEEKRLKPQEPEEQQETPDTTTKGVSLVSPVLEKLEVFIRPDSLKAWRLEQDKQKDEEGMKKMKKEKGEKSSAKGVEKAESTRESKKSREDDSVTPNTHTEQRNEERVEIQRSDTHTLTHTQQEPVFMGYRMGGRLVQVRSESQFVFPLDGGQISVEKVHYKQGSTRLKVSVRKNGHCFYTHITEPETKNTHDQRQKYSCFYAVLNNGLTLAYRHTHQLHVSHPTGLQIKFSLQHTADGQAVLVRQSLPASGSKLPVTHTEMSRTITCNGAVIKHMRDGSTTVLFADGTVSVSPDSGPVSVIVRTKVEKIEDTSTHTHRKEAKGKTSSAVKSEGAEPASKVEFKVELKGGLWCTTAPSGERIRTIKGERVEEKPVQTIYCTDPHTHTVVVTRDDGVLSVLEKHRVVVDHADGTRMISYQQRETLSQQLSGGSDGGRANTVQVEKSGYATVLTKCEEKSAQVLLRNGTTISATADGSYRVCLSDGSCLSLREDGVTEYTSTGPEGDQRGRYIMSHSEGLVCEHTDSEGNHYQVTADGEVSVSHTHTDKESEKHHNTGFNTHTPRLFMVCPDGSALEFLSSQTVDEILQKEDTDRSVAVIREPIPHTQEAFAITILKPFFDPSSYWHIPKHLDDIIPANLKNRKWDTFPASEVKTPGPPLGLSPDRGVELKDGTTSGSDPTPLVLQNPNTLLIRRITEHTPFTDEHYQQLQNQLLLYINQLLRKEKLKDEMKLKDPHTAEEKRLHSDLLRSHQTPELTPESMLSLYSQAVGVQSTPPPTATKQQSDQQVTLSKPKQKSNWENRIQQHRFDLQETARHRHALRHQIITPYFHPESQEVTYCVPQRPSSRSQKLPSVPRRRIAGLQKFNNSY